jgi:1-deoxy-D-xylulose-5-phosphate reductoisomerase
MPHKKKIAILGSTGSVGKSTLSVIALHGELYDVYALTANTKVDELFSQCQQFAPKFAVMSDEASAAKLTELIKTTNLLTEVLSGADALVSLMADQDIDSVMVAIVGAIGLEPSLAAVRSAKQVMIANKEPLVMAGDLFMAEAEKSGATILPIDSEHNAIFQCLPYPFEDKTQIRRLVLTASGGPFLGKAWSDLQDVTPEQAIAHPNWSMGPKISVDSATMMNKGLELIEATHLFGLSADKIDVIIHPQSVIHSMVEYVDGSYLSQLGSPDMCIPIAHALAWPKRIDSGAQSLDLAKMARLDFQEPNWVETPCLSIAKQVASQGGYAPIVMNAANEVAVENFIKKSIGFTDIYKVIDTVLSDFKSTSVSTVSDVLDVDSLARDAANHAVSSCCS